MNKYKKDNQFENDDNNNQYLRPINEKDIRNLTNDDLYSFIDDIYKDEKVNKILFSTMAKKEIKYYEKENQKMEKYMRIKSARPKIEKNEKKESTLSEFLKKQKDMAEYGRYKTIMDNIKKENDLINEEKYKKLERSYSQYKKESDQQLIDNQNRNLIGKVSDYKRVFGNLKDKLNRDNIWTSPSHIQSDSENNISNLNNISKITDSTTSTTSKLLFPNCELNVKNVYSRLYHNAVCHVPVNIDKKRNFSHKRTKKFNGLNEEVNKALPSIEKNNDEKKTKFPNEKIFKVKNVFGNSNGKEFTVKVNEDMHKKCFSKYSGGITGLKELEEIQNKEIEKGPITNIKNKEEYSLFNYKGKRGNSFLHNAVEEGLIVMVKHLIAKGSNINAQNDDGDTPLHIALRNKNYEISEYLLDNGASILIFNNKGELSYDLADSHIRGNYEFSDYFSKVEELKKKRKEQIAQSSFKRLEI